MTVGSLIEELLPQGIAAADAKVAGVECALFPAEMALVERAVPSRQVEFATARQCARRALAKLSIAPVPILAGAARQPLWPDGVAGSITHCVGYHAAAVCRTSDFCSIGIDAEIDEPLPDGVLDDICLDAERAQLGRLREPHADRLLFSAKESVYKAWFPLAGRWLGFDQALITLRPDGNFDVELLIPGPLGFLQGRWLVRDGLILTAISVPNTALL